MLALGLTGVVYRAVFGVTGSALSVATFPPLGDPASPILAPLRQPAPVYLALMLVPFAWRWCSFAPASGWSSRAAGEAPEAAASLGISVGRVRVGRRS